MPIEAVPQLMAKADEKWRDLLLDMAEFGGWWSEILNSTKATLLDRIVISRIFMV